jgi:mono/diheme cytochrome c family protein
MHLLNYSILTVTFVAGIVAWAQEPPHKLGRVPTEEEIRAMDTIVGPRGKELPPGRGTANDGAPLFAKKCAVCHGQNGQGTKVAPSIIGELAPDYPFATAIWSYIYNAMPRKAADPGLREEALTAGEVYSLTAFILYKDHIIKEDDVLDEKTLPKVHMPKRDHRLDGLAPPDRGVEK